MNFVSQDQFYQYLVQCSNAYYNTGEPLISDIQFDSLVQKYESTFHTTYQYLGKSTHSKNKLPVYMGSLDKIKTQSECLTFLNRFSKQSNYIVSMKMDGISILYNPSKKQLLTRGDGSIGSNVSHLIQHLQLPAIDRDIWIRGELCLPKSIKNARNIVSGFVNSKTVDTSISPNIHFFAYQVFDTFQSYQDQLQFLLDHKFETPQFTQISADQCTESFLFHLITKWKSECLFDIDGLVIQHNTDLTLYSGQNPKNACAFKLTNPTKQTIVKQVEWNQSAFFSWHPIVNIEPVEWDGILIQNCSGFHAQYIFNNKIGPGSIVEITRANDVIPDIVNVLQQAKQPQMPEDYSESSEDWYWKGVHLYSKSQSQQSVISQLVRFFSSVDVSHLKDKTIETILKGCPSIKSESDFLFRLTKPMLTSLDKFGDKKSDLVLQSIELCKQKLTLVAIMKGSAMFQGFSEKKLDKLEQTLATCIKNYIHQKQNFPEQILLQECHNNSIIKNASDFINQLQPFCDKYHELLVYLFQKQQTPIPKQKLNLPNHGVVVFTGFRDKDLKIQAENQGWSVADTITKSTKLVVATSKSKIYEYYCYV
jgi:NAD-dependent DNA ligase